MKNNFEYVDLGLPSGTLWAKSNAPGFYTFDEAVEKFGDNLPSKEDWDELFEHCSRKRDNEHNGLVLTGPNGNTVFLPAVGYHVGSDGYYWPSRLNSGEVGLAYRASVYSGGKAPRDLSYRYNRFSVRLARGSK